MRITILHSSLIENASPDEQDTMQQVAVVQAALESLGHRVDRLAFTLDFQHVLQELHRRNPDRVFNLVESIAGKGDKIFLPALLLEQMGMPYTGANSQSLLLTTDKILAKQWMLAGGLPTAKWFLIDEDASLPEDGPYIIKLVDEDGSIGIEQDSVVHDTASLRAIARERKQRFGGKWFAEKFIDGREFNVTLLANDDQVQVLKIAEIRFQHVADDAPRIVDYAANWYPESASYQSTEVSFEFTSNDNALLNALTETSIAAWNWFKLTGFARIDIRVDEQGNIFILEINANPSLDAFFSAAASHAGLQFQDVMRRLLDHAVETQQPRDRVC